MLKKLIKKLKSLRRRWFWWSRKNIIMPLANKLIGSYKKYTVRMVSDIGVTYDAEYHRTRYWYDEERITIRGIFQKRKVWHVTYWDKGVKPGWGGIEMWVSNGGPDMFYGNKKEAEIKARSGLECTIERWEAITKRRKEEPECEKTE